jgi:limonene-1,2-epoxide hydrolase
VRRFLELVREWSDADEMSELVSDDFEYEGRVPSEPIRGRAAFRAEMQRQFSLASDIESRILAIASNGRHVFTERVDNFKMGATQITFKVTAVFEVAGDGRISAWREYWDALDLAGQLGLSPNDLQSRYEAPAT